MKRNLIFAGVAAFLLCCPAVSVWNASAQDGGRLVIEKTSKQANPTLNFRSVTGDKALSDRVLSNLRNCGWFDLVRSGATDYILSGEAAGESLTLTLMNGAGLKMQEVTVQSADLNARAAKGVDGILKKLFDIPGICQSKIVFSAETGGGNREIYSCDFDGGNITRITKNHTLSVEPVWTPDGRSIVYCCFGAGFTHLAQYRFDDGKSRWLTRYKGINAGGALSPDGKYLALVLGIGNQVDLYIRETEGSRPIRITNDKAVEASPVWTPDGKKICYVSDVRGRPQLYIVDPFGKGAPERLRDLRGSERVTPDFSADGVLAYSAKVGGDYVVTIASLTKPGDPEFQIGLPDQKDIPGEGPSWAPDNRHVVVSRNGVLMVVDTRLGRQRRLVGGQSKAFQPDWSPLLPVR